MSANVLPILLSYFRLLTSRSVKHAAVTAGIAFVAILLGIGWGMPSEFSPSWDSPVPFSPLAFVAEYSNPDIANKYPALHNLVLLPVYGLVFVCFAVAGGVGELSTVWPHGLANPYLFFTCLIVASRVVTSVMAAAVIGLFTLITLPGTSIRSRVVGAALFGFSGTFTYFARVGNVDIPCMFWWVLCVALLYRYYFAQSENRHTWMFIASAVCCGAAVATKDSAFALGIGLGIWVALSPRSRNWKAHLRTVLLYGIVALGCYVLFAIVPHPVRWFHHVKLWTLNGAFVKEFAVFENTPSGQLYLGLAFFNSLVRVISIPAILLASWGALSLVRKGASRQLWFFVLPILAYYFIIIFNIRFLHDRFLLPVAFVIAILATVGISDLAAKCAQDWRKRFVSATVLLALALQLATGYLPVTICQLRDVKQQLSRDLGRLVENRGPILWIGYRVDLPNSDTYRHFDLVLPNGQRPKPRSSDHAFSRKLEWKYLLSSRPIAKSEFGELTLIRVWNQNPAVLWAISSHIKKLRFKSYYLYSRASEIDQKI